MHENFVALAERLISKHGRTVYVRRETYIEDSVEPWKKTEGSSKTTDYAVKAVFLDEDSRNVMLSIPGRPDQPTTMEGSLDRYVMIPAGALPIDVTIADSIVDGDRVWKITQIQLIQPGATPIVWRLKVEN